jgi:hypothetical protein
MDKYTLSERDICIKFITRPPYGRRDGMGCDVANPKEVGLAKTDQQLLGRLR